MDMWVSPSFRTAPYPTSYEARRTPVTTDVTVTVIVYVTSALLLAGVVYAVSKRRGQKLPSLIRTLFITLQLGSILLCNYGQAWEVAALHTQTPYRAGISKEINASIRVQIGLRSVNISLKGMPKVQNLTNTTKETIDYNERFSWNDDGWLQGYHGEGYMDHAFRTARFRGTPLPILWIAEYFVIDGEGIRWGRHYRQAGYYTHIALWLAVPLWLLACVLSAMLPTYGAFYAILTGLDLVGACVLYSWIRNETELSVALPDGRLVFYWGWTYWTCLSTGVISFLLGIIIYLVDIYYPDSVVVFFGGTITNNIEDFCLNDLKLVQESGKGKEDVPQGRMTSMDFAMTSASSLLTSSYTSLPVSTYHFRSGLQSPTMSSKWSVLDDLDKQYKDLYWGRTGKDVPVTGLPPEQQGFNLRDPEKDDTRKDLDGSVEERRLEEVVTVKAEFRRVIHRRKRKAPLAFLKKATRVRRRMAISKATVVPQAAAIGSNLKDS